MFDLLKLESLTAICETVVWARCERVQHMLGNLELDPTEVAHVRLDLIRYDETGGSMKGTVEKEMDLQV